MATKVRLTDAEEFPDHHRDDCLPSILHEPEIWARYRGTVITIGKPEKPIACWTCGTDIVFPVLGAEMQEPEIERGLVAKGYVCRHQIQAGD